MMIVKVQAASAPGSGAAVVPPTASSTPPPAAAPPGAGDHAPPDMDAITTQVIRRIERRAIAQRERLGGR
jgi:hypothetical protein